MGPTGKMALFAASLLFPGIAFPAAAQSPKDEGLLKLVRDAHQSSYDSLVTVSCRVNFTLTFESRPAPYPLVERCSAECWYSPEAVRVKVIEANKREIDYVWKNSIRTAIVKQPSGSAGATRATYSERHLHRCDAWIRGLLAIDLPGTTTNLPFKQLLERASQVVDVRQKRVDGRDLIIVKLLFVKDKERSKDWTAEIHFDSAANYLVRKAVYERDGYKREAEVERFVEVGDGLFFPARVVTSDKLTSSCTEFSEIRVNQPLPVGIFELRYPPGVYVADSIRYTYYRVDEHGNQTSEETPMDRGPLPPANQGGLLEEIKQEMRTETQAEPRSWIRFIAPVSLGVLALAGLGYLIRRRRQASPSV